VVSCTIQLIRPVFFVRWKQPAMSDLALLGNKLEQAHEDNGRPVIYVAIIPEDCEPPNDAMRKRFADTMHEVLSHCRTMHFVMEGQGFKSAILRNALAAVLLVRGQRNKVFVHKTIEEALMTAQKLTDHEEDNFDVGTMLKQARQYAIATNTRAGDATRV
jgi:hypothetical protein